MHVKVPYSPDSIYLCVVILQIVNNQHKWTTNEKGKRRVWEWKGNANSKKKFISYGAREAFCASSSLSFPLCLSNFFIPFLSSKNGPGGLQCVYLTRGLSWAERRCLPCLVKRWSGLSKNDTSVQYSKHTAFELFRKIDCPRSISMRLFYHYTENICLLSARTAYPAG